MARTSRKNISDLDEDRIICYKTAIYARLSNKNSGYTKDVEIIKNQIMICENHIEAMEELKLVETYVDDGFTGTNMERPALRNLLKDIALGRIDCLVVKDLSRLGRNYIEVGNLIDELIKLYKIRLIVINEHYDSNIEPVAGLLIPLKNMINDMYSKELSKKVSESLRRLRLEGKSKIKLAPYGYKIDESKMKLLVDHEVIDNIKLIFNMKYDGCSNREISNALIERNAITPSEYKYMKGGHIRMPSKNIRWSEKTLKNIYTNRVYIGDTVYGKTKSSLYEGIDRTISIPKSEWSYIEGTHEGIIEKEIFMQINQRKEKRVLGNKTDNPFKGRMYCAYCGGRMALNHKHYACIKKVGEINRKAHETRIYIEDVRYVLNDMIKVHIECVNKNDLLVHKQSNMESLDELKLDLKKLQYKKIQLYENWSNGLVTREEYDNIKNVYTNQINEKQEIFNQVLAKQSEQKDKLKCISMIQNNTNYLELESYYISKLIEKIIVDIDGGVTIKLKYKDLFQERGESCRL